MDEIGRHQVERHRPGCPVPRVQQMKADLEPLDDPVPRGEAMRRRNKRNTNMTCSMCGGSGEIAPSADWILGGGPGPTSCDHSDHDLAETSAMLLTAEEWNDLAVICMRYLVATDGLNVSVDVPRRDLAFRIIESDRDHPTGHLEVADHWHTTLVYLDGVLGPHRRSCQCDKHGCEPLYIPKNLDQRRGWYDKHRMTDDERRAVEEYVRMCEDALAGQVDERG